MLRAIAAVGFIAALILVVLAGSRLMQNPDGNAKNAGQPECDLLSGPCVWETGAGSWRANLDSLGNKGQGMEYRLTLRTPLAPERFLAVLRGESMFMGEYPVPLRKVEPGEYSAHFTAPVCTTSPEMVWRIDLQKGQQLLFKDTPLKLVFMARDHLVQ